MTKATNVNQNDLNSHKFLIEMLYDCTHSHTQEKKCLACISSPEFMDSARLLDFLAFLCHFGRLSSSLISFQNKTLAL